MTDQFAITQKAVLLGPAPERRVLLLRKPRGAWELPGGPLREDESPEEGLKRAVRESTGLDVAVNRPVHTTAWNFGAGSAFAVIYRARSETERATLAGDHEEAVWVEPNQTGDRDLTDAQRLAIKRATSL